jgi:hypothetical protein
LPENPVEPAGTARDTHGMTSTAQPGAADEGWDGAFYHVRTDRFEAFFLPGAGEDLDAVCNVDVEVWLAQDHSRWSATVFTLAEVGRLMEKDSRTGEALGGRYFWCSDGLIVRDPGIGSMTRVIAGMLDSGDFRHVLQRFGEDDAAPRANTSVHHGCDEPPGPGLWT